MLVASRKTARSLAIWVWVVALFAGILYLSLLNMGLVPRNRDPDRELATYMRLTAVTDSIHAFHSEHGRYPRDMGELWRFIRDRSGDTIVADGYFTDAWGRRLRYVGRHPKLNQGDFDLYSVGKNGIDEYANPEFGDDIHVYADGVTALRNADGKLYHPGRRGEQAKSRRTRRPEPKGTQE